MVNGQNGKWTKTSQGMLSFILKCTCKHPLHTHTHTDTYAHAHIQSKRLRAVGHYLVVHEKKQMTGHVNDTEIQYSYAGWTKKHQQTKHCHPPTFHAVSNVLGGFDLRHLLVKWHVIWHQVIIAGNETKAHIFTDIHQLMKLLRHTTTIFLYVLFFTFQCVSKYVHVCQYVLVCVCLHARACLCTILGRGGRDIWWQICVH